ncbi:uncharacterized protein [Bos indicus]|uniref:Uncharacterized protein isoform X1 n=1 Tax=Bos indicus TaxID=9915 RepID=A0ABM4RWI9_BOSIN
MTLGKGLPVRTPSCLCGCDEVVWGLHSPTSAAFFDILQASSSRPTDSLPGQPVRTVVTDLCLQATLWISIFVEPCDTPQSVQKALKSEKVGQLLSLDLSNKKPYLVHGLSTL